MIFYVNLGIREIWIKSYQKYNYNYGIKVYILIFYLSTLSRFTSINKYFTFLKK